MNKILYTIKNKLIIVNLVLLFHFTLIVSNPGIDESHASELKIQQLEKEDYKIELAEYLNSSGLTLWQKNEYDKAIEYFKKSIEINQKIKNENAIKALNNYIGLVFYDKGEYDSSIFYLNKSLKYSKKSDNKDDICDQLISISIAYQGKEKYEKSSQIANQALEIAKELNNIKRLKSVYNVLAENYDKLGMHDKSFEYFNMASSLTKYLQEQEIKSLEIKKKQAEIEKHKKEKELLNTVESLEEAKKENKQISLNLKLINKEKELKELALKEEEARSRELSIKERTRRQMNYYFGAGLVLFVLFFLILLIQFRQKNKANKLLASKNDEIQKQKEEIEIQRDLSNKQKQKVTSSINYAKQIQAAVLPPQSLIKSIFPEHFVFYRPKDIVSGDFYWLTEKEGIVIIAAADCTGHGVPGAFMSMLGIAFLNEIVNKIGINKHIRSFKASEILDQLREKVIQSLHQTYDVENLKDGMDIALCIIDIEHHIMQYAGAHNPVYIIRNKELIQLSPDKIPIGIYGNTNLSFTNHEIKIETGDNLYMFSDGYFDQFGGGKSEKFMIKNFRNLLLEIHEKPMKEQLSLLEHTIDEFIGNHEQMDDMLIVGIKIAKQIKKHTISQVRNWESKRILIAEDTDINYFLLSEALKPTNAQIFRANNGEEAVNFCMSNEVDLILMDINMPVLNGLEATIKIREFKKNIPIIAQTAQSQPDDVDKCKGAGCNDYIAKPIDLKTFLNKIEELI